MGGSQLKPHWLALLVTFGALIPPTSFLILQRILLSLLGFPLDLHSGEVDAWTSKAISLVTVLWPVRFSS